MKFCPYGLAVEDGGAAHGTSRRGLGVRPAVAFPRQCVPNSAIPIRNCRRGSRQGPVQGRPPLRQEERRAGSYACLRATPFGNESIFKLSDASALTPTGRTGVTATTLAHPWPSHSASPQLVPGYSCSCSSPLGIWHELRRSVRCPKSCSRTKVALSDWEKLDALASPSPSCLRQALSEVRGCLHPTECLV